MSRSIAGILLAVAVVVLASCTTVEPWQRGRLAKPEMAPDPNALQTELRDHVHESREGATSGPSGKGGGCGCY